MKQHFKILLLVSTALFSNLSYSLSSSNGLSENEQERINRAIQIIKSNYVDPISNKTLFKNTMKGITDSLDPHSSYLDSEDLRDLTTLTSGRLSGIGLEITIEDGFIKVITPLDDSPAQKAGIKAGDTIIRIDNVLTKGLTLREAANKMRGPKGTLVKLTILHKEGNKPVQLKLVRADIKLQSVKSRLLEPGLGYLRISGFEEDTSIEVESAIKKLNIENKNPLQGLILDLRNNPGGLLDSATKVADDFLDPTNMKYKNLIVYTKGRAPDSDMKIFAKPNDLLSRAPIIVLINEGSASGAEIVAGALQDHKRALIVGTRSFGKGSVQTVIPLSNDSAIKITTALYYTPAGRSIQATGIVPDVKIDDLKITQATEDNLASIYVKEADLQGHLINNQSKIINSLTSDKETISSKKLITSDYQLAVALYLLEGMAAWMPKQH